MPKARLYFDGDNSWIEKEARIYGLTQEVEDKLDSISDFQDEIDDLQDQINNLASRGRYLSTWNCVTWLPWTDPQVDPYVYRAWDYYIVSNVGGTNLRPTGAEYHVQVPSQVTESQSVSVNDLYIYDWIQWILQWSWSSIYAVWWSITWTLSAQTDLQNALNNKANLTDLYWFTVVNSLPTLSSADEKTVYILWPIGTWVDKYEEYIVTEDSQQQKQWTKIWETSVDLSDLNTKTFFMTGQNYFSEAIDIYNWYMLWKNPIIIYDWCTYLFDWYSASTDPTISFMNFVGKLITTSSTDNTWTQMKGKSIRIEVTSWQVTDVAFFNNTSVWPKFLSTNNTSATPFTPTHDSHPATKKYVDDSIISTQTGNLLTSWMKIWAWTEADYWNLGTYDSNTLYLTV